MTGASARRKDARPRRAPPDGAELMDELLDHPQALRLLRTLAQQGPMNMRAFTFLSQMAPANAKALREKMERWGLIHVTDEATRRTTSDLEIRLTKEGEEIAKLLFAVDPILEQAKKKGLSRAADRK